MSAVEKINIALPTEMVALLRRAVDAGEYASSSEVVREALRDWTRKRQLHDNGIAELRRLWRTAQQPRLVRPSDDVLERLER